MQSEFAPELTQSTVTLYENCIKAILCILFFFFQAEDGIRDTSVTGVQTCALPISRATGCEAVSVASWRISLALTLSVARIYSRSEERRVGKECRSRWATYD